MLKYCIQFFVVSGLIVDNIDDVLSSLEIVTAWINVQALRYDYSAVISRLQCHLKLRFMLIPQLLKTDAN